MNFPIQSTVADTCMLALWMMADYRQQFGLGFRIINQIHDAILLEVPQTEIAATKQMCFDTMANIYIPLEAGRSLKLDVDVDVMSRWGESSDD